MIVRIVCVLALESSLFQKSLFPTIVSLINNSFTFDSLTKIFKPLINWFNDWLKGPPSYPKSGQHLHISSSMVCRAGSLPNVNQIGQNSNKQGIDLQTALNNLEDIKQGREGRNGGRNVSPNRSAYSSIGQSRHNNSQFQSEPRRVVVSPHSVTYLSPPPDTNWRRTNSDSALHQSALMSNSQPFETFHQNAIPIPRRSTVHDMDSSMIVDDSQGIDSWDPGKQDRYNRYDKYLLNASLPDNSRPKSCEVPGIMICPTQEDFNSLNNNNHSTHIPISSNTGSLPDLTSLHFPAPLTTPIDVDDQNAAYQANSPYQSGPDSPYSPHSPHNNSNLSPPPPMAIQQIRSGVANCAVNDSNHRQMSPSPGPSPSPTSSRRRHHHNINNLVIGNPRHQHHSSGPHSPLQQTVGYTHTSSPPRITVEVRRQFIDYSISHSSDGFHSIFTLSSTFIVFVWTPYFCSNLISILFGLRFDICLENNRFIHSNESIVTNSSVIPFCYIFRFLWVLLLMTFNRRHETN